MKNLVWLIGELENWEIRGRLQSIYTLMLLYHQSIFCGSKCFDRGVVFESGLFFELLRLLSKFTQLIEKF